MRAIQRTVIVALIIPLAYAIMVGEGILAMWLKNR